MLATKAGLEIGMAKLKKSFILDTPRLAADSIILSALFWKEYFNIRNIYGNKVVIGMGAGSISNWIKELPQII